MIIQNNLDHKMKVTNTALHKKYIQALCQMNLMEWCENKQYIDIVELLLRLKKELEKNDLKDFQREILEKYVNFLKNHLSEEMV